MYHYVYELTCEKQSSNSAANAISSSFGYENKQARQNSVRMVGVYDQYVL